MIGTNNFNPLSLQPTAANLPDGQAKSANANFAYNLTENLNDMSMIEIFDRDTPEGPHDKMTNDEFQRDWLSKVLQLPEGLGWNDEQLMAHIEAQTAPILFSFEELFSRFGVQVNWEYDAEGNKIGTVVDSPGNRAAASRMDAHINSIINRLAINPEHPAHKSFRYARTWEDRVNQNFVN
ncbi:MAG: hypothetical protein FWG64_00045 [Firmicutes bacterium]|nr:hypothetical protein [Bacillota bacterium]